MIALLSPAKSLDFNTSAPIKEYSTPYFLKKSETLVNILKKKSVKKLGDTLKISAALADLNYQRYQEWKIPFTPNNAKQAAFAFTGDVYRGLNATELDKRSINYLQDHVRILSGLYGVLRPLDLIQAYRLEMGTKLNVNSSAKNLYEFWKQNVTNKIKEELEDKNAKAIVNLASNEYFKVVDMKAITVPVITPVFKDFKNGDYKMIMVYAKEARGAMAAFMAKHKIKKKEELKAFDTGGYRFNPELSEDEEWVFTRG